MRFSYIGDAYVERYGAVIVTIFREFERVEAAYQDGCHHLFCGGFDLPSGDPDHHGTGLVA
jgi:hypothetical protein